MKRSGWLVGVLVAVSLVAPAPARAAGPDLFESAAGLVTFSPNGDGRRDVARVNFRLAVAAHVTAKVKAGDVVVRTVDLGRLRKGRHVFGWDGRSRLGRMLPDGRYALVLVAQTAEGRDSAFTALDVDTVNCARLSTTRPTVYPRATAVADLVQVVLVDCDWNSWAAEMGDVLQSRTRLEVLDRHGNAVREQVVRHQTTPTFSWNGRRETGQAVRAGAYQLWVTSVDPAGNRRRFLATVRVSWEQLAEQTTSFTVPAAQAGHYIPEFGGCNGCSDSCAPLASTRFAGGLSFQPCQSPYLYGARGYFAAYPPVLAAAPVDSYRVTVTGGPTTAGEDDTAILVVGGQLVTTTPVGDGTSTSDWLPVALNAYPYLPVGDRPVFWSFGTNTPDAYDVASFTVDYRSYVPA